MRYAARVDANQEQIVSAMRAAGASVTIIKLPVDLLIGYAGVTCIAEVKDPKSTYGKKGLNKNQRDFQAGWKGGPLALIDSVESGLRLLKMMENHTKQSELK
jgi:hypothetical protein